MSSPLLRVALAAACAPALAAACQPAADTTRPARSAREAAARADAPAGGEKPADPRPAARAAAERPRVVELPRGCGPAKQKFACNPVTNEGCKPEAGEACDDDEHGGFSCYPSPNEVKLGGECNVVDGPSCAPGLGCDGASESDPEGRCGKYCCASGDCTKPQKCVVIDKDAGSLGFCK